MIEKHQIVFLKNVIGLSDLTIAILIGIHLGLNIDPETINDDEFTVILKNRILERDYVNSRYIVNLSGGETETFDKLNAVTHRIDEYRKLFRGIRPKSIGNKQLCIEKMQKFLLSTDYTFDDVITATEYYIQQADTNFIQNADNFIYSINFKGDEQSSLLTAIEEYKMGIGNEGRLI